KLYACSKYLREGRLACGHHAVHEDKLLSMVAGAIRDHFSNPELVQHLREQIARKERTRRMEAEGRALLLRKRVAELGQWVKDGSGRLAKVPDDVLPGLVAEIRTWKAELEEAEKELHELERRETAQRRDEAAVDKALARLQRLPEIVRKGDQSLVRDLLRSIIDRVEL